MLEEEKQNLKKTRPVRAKESLLGLDFVLHLVKSSGDIHCINAVFIFVSACPRMERVDTKGSDTSTCLTAVVVGRTDPLFPGLLVQLTGVMCSLMLEGLGDEAPGNLEQGLQKLPKFHSGHSRKSESHESWLCLIICHL